MRSQNIDEYNKVRDALKDVQNCITHYLQGFFLVCGSLVTLAVVIPRLGMIPGSQYQKLVFPSFGFILIVFCFITISFTSIMFHKFITHNRYAGYAQVIAYELGGRYENVRLPNPFFALERCLFDIYRQEISKIIPISNSKVEIDTIKYLTKCDLSCGVKKGKWKFIMHCLRGAWMTVRAPINKEATTSWTYPYFVAFGLLSILAFLAVSLLAVIVISLSGRVEVSGDIFALNYQILIEVFCLLYILCCFAGMFNRLYRACGPDGDRTITFFFYRFALARQAALESYDVIYRWENIPPPPEL